ncbi:MAG: SAM-dependent methyltransferase, partial [Muribaculaceae bacterium]|nr:SAM-dependent methyltransferase [Muribaculaceae bacterium]
MMKALIDRILNKNFIESNNIIQSISGIVDYFSSEEEKNSFVSFYNHSYEFVCEDRSTYGDWQTPQKLAREICLNHRSAFGAPDVVIEPTCGKGAFVKAALDVF